MEGEGAWQVPTATGGHRQLQEGKTAPLSPSRAHSYTGRPSCPCAEKKHYRESYISDTLDLDLDLDPGGRGSPGSPHSGGSRDSGGSSQHLHHRLSVRSADSHSSSHTSGIEADVRPLEPGEMSVDVPLGAEAPRAEAPPCSSSTSQSSHCTDGGSGDRPEGDTKGWADGECASRPAPGWATVVGTKVTRMDRTPGEVGVHVTVISM